MILPLLFALLTSDCSNCDTRLLRYQETLKTEDNAVNRMGVYWEMSAIYDYLKDYDKAAETLMLFTLYSEEIKAKLSENTRGFSKKDIKAVLQELNYKLNYSYIMLEVYWNKKQKDNCRTKNSACILTTSAALDLYKLELPFCAERYAKKTENKQIELTMKCDDKLEKYYFYER